MMYVVITSKEGWERYCGRGCRCLLDSGQSKFKMNVFDEKENVINYIANELFGKEDQPYLFIICENFKDLLNHSYASHSYDKGINSIVYPYISEYNYEDYSSFFNDEQRITKLIDEIRESVQIILASKK